MQLETLAKRMADEASDFIILNRRFHRQLIGTGGENIKVPVSKSYLLYKGSYTLLLNIAYCNWVGEHA